jgi:multimeric flavodoxin WrbA
MAKIRILVGSPRPKGTTQRLIKEFVKGAQMSHNEIDRFRVASMRISGCIGCQKGSLAQDKAKPCIIHDEMDKIYEAMLSSDVIVWASGMYMWNFPSQLKAVIDRSYALMEADPSCLKGKKTAILLASGDSGEANLASISSMAKEWFAYMGLDSLGIINLGDCSEPSDAEGRPELKAAFELGQSIS